jgi:hypothetical protein
MWSVCDLCRTAALAMLLFSGGIAAADTYYTNRRMIRLAFRIPKLLEL